MLDKNLSNEIVNRIIHKIKVNKIILFGSYSKGFERKDSDIDLLIITDENKRQIELMIEIRKMLSGLKKPFDILVYNADNFYKRADSKTSFERDILDTGTLLYGKKHT